MEGAPLPPVALLRHARQLPGLCDAWPGLMRCNPQELHDACKEAYREPVAVPRAHVERQVRAAHGPVHGLGQVQPAAVDGGSRAAQRWRLQRRQVARQLHALL